MSKRKKKLISVTIDPDLYTQARAKGLNLSAILNEALETQLNQTVNKETHPHTIKKIYPKALYNCDLCGPRLGGQYHSSGDKTYCNTCGRSVTQA